MTDALLKNWLTTLGGILAGLPAIIFGSGIQMPPRWSQIVTIAGGIGVLILGVSAKQWNNHSTMDQVVQSSHDEEDVATKK